MEIKHHFKITRYTNPKEIIFDGDMTFTEARRFMDKNASFMCRVGFEVYNEDNHLWETFDDCYHGGRKVWDKGDLYILDPDYKSMWLPENCRWYLWYKRSSGRRFFIQSFKTEEQANRRRDYLTAEWLEGTYIVEPSDITEDMLP